MEIIISSGEYFNTCAEPKARAELKAGPHSRHHFSPAPSVASVHGQLVHLESISGRSSRDCAYLHREFKQLITKAIFFFYYYSLQTKLINQIAQDAHYAKLN